MAQVIEQQSPSTETAPRQTQSAQAEVIAQRLAQFRETMALIEAIPDRRAEAGLGPLPDNFREMAYEEREAASL